MTTPTDIVNRALQAIGTRTTVTDAELAGNLTNEAIQANLIMNTLRDDLLRMAPWDCALKVANITYITSAPGTPENSSPQTQLWQRGQPAPPWAYEYQYPVDCLRACWIIPTNQLGYGTGVPITTAVTGAATSFWQGPPVRFKVQTDQFYPVTAAAVANGGSGYNVGDIWTGARGISGNPPIGAPVQLLVTSVGGGGVITGVTVVNVIMDATITGGGSYFARQANPVAQGSTSRNGSGATFNLTFGAAQISQRVILTNQEFATLTYIQQVSDPNVMDKLFQTAWYKILGASLSRTFTGDKKLANDLIEEANGTITEARSIDANEGYTVNDVTPDWIRARGLNYTEGYTSGPYTGYDWGGLWPLYL